MATSDETALAANARVHSRGRPEWLTGGGTSGNERLTTVTGATLIVLLAVIGLAILVIPEFGSWLNDTGLFHHHHHYHHHH